MTSPKRFQPSATEELPVELQEFERLMATVSGPERAALQSAWGRVAASFHRRRRILSLVQEALSQLRLDVKYLLFDLETTRRERDRLQAQLEEEDRGF